jgi:hypothetical protein
MWNQIIHSPGIIAQASFLLGLFENAKMFLLLIFE